MGVDLKKSFRENPRTNCEDRADNGYPARSHDCMPDETEFANSQEDAQLDLERREKNAKKSRTMLMWKNALESTWKNRPTSEVQKLIDRQPKIMQAIIEKDGGRTGYRAVRVRLRQPLQQVFV